MSITPSDCITERHLLLFGSIVRWFARHEVLMQQIIATVIGSRSTDIMLLTRPLTTREKRIALLGLLRHREIPLDRFDAVYKYLTILETFGSLASDIEHSAWIAGKVSRSIQPDWILKSKRTIKPVHSGEDGRSPGVLEDYEDQVEYTVEELTEIVENLGENYQRFSAYCRSVGLLVLMEKEVG